MPHRESIKDYIRQKIGVIENVSVVDWGCGTKHVDRYGIFGKGVKYFSIDKLDHVGADLVTDMQKPLDLGKMYDVAFCLEVLEHVPDYNALLDNIFQNLRFRGTLYLSVPFLLEVHHPEDYWRFTNIGLEYLLEQHGFIVEEIVETEGRAGWIAKAKKE